MISLEDFKKLRNADEIRDALALPGKPSHFSLAEIPEGTIIRESQSAAVWQEGAFWGKGGMRQYQIQGFSDIDPKISDTWFSETQRLNNFYDEAN